MPTVTIKQSVPNCKKAIIIHEYICPKCKIKWTAEEWHIPEEAEKEKKLLCDECSRLAEQKTFHTRSEKLTTLQKAMLKGDKAWKEDIMSRRKLPNGDIAVIDRVSGKVKEVRPRQGVKNRG